MSRHTAIHEPFLLANYTTTQRLAKKGRAKSSKPLPNLFTTYEKAAGRSDGYVTTAVQGGGVHVLDVATLRPLISHTLGPSTSFACPAITRQTLEESNKICTTFAVIDASPDINESEGGRTIWMWRENLSQNLVDRASRSKNSVVIRHPVAALHSCHDIPSRLFAVSPNGDLTVLSTELEVKGTWTRPAGLGDPLRTFIFSRQACTFVRPQTSSSGGAIVVTFAQKEGVLEAGFIAIDGADTFQSLGDVAIVSDSEEFVDVACSASGEVSLLTRDGCWQTYHFRPEDESVKNHPTAEPFALAGLSFPSSKVDGIVSILALSSSHVLLAGVTNSPNPDIVLLLWDSKYSVVLASQNLPIPSTFTQSKDTSLSLSLVAASPSQALLVLSSYNIGKAQTSSQHSSVLVVPLVAPGTSTIANAIGKAVESAKWIKPSAGSPVNGVDTHDSSRQNVLETMKAALEQHKPQEASKAFFEWEKVADAPANGDVPSKGKEGSTDLDYTFVQELLLVVLQPSQPANAPYPSEVVRHLVERKCVSSGMLQGGLLRILKYRNDWPCIQIAFTKVSDLSEAEIIEILRVVVAQHEQSKGADSMQVDSALTVPPLADVLKWCICYQTSPAPLRAAIQTQLRDPAEILSILHVLDGWVGKWGKTPLKLMPNKKEVVPNEHGVPVVKIREKEDKRDLPSLDKVVDFLQAVLDVSFVSLLQHPPAHTVLRKLSVQVEPEISFSEQIERLRGSLEPFALAHRKAIKEAEEGKPKEPVGDWRQRKKQVHEQAGLGVGLYRLEELVL